MPLHSNIHKYKTKRGLCSSEDGKPHVAVKMVGSEMHPLQHLQQTSALIPVLCFLIQKRVSVG